MSEQSNSLKNSTDLLVLMPLLCTAIGATFDVGYFSAVDINYFTFFSLSEHLVFALEALPMALILCSIMTLAILEWDVLNARHKRNQDKIRSKRKELVRAITKILVLACSWLLTFYLGYRNIWHMFVLACSLSIFFTAVLVFPELLSSRRGMLAYGSITTLIFSFVYGHTAASSYLIGPEIMHQVFLADSTLEGRIIRSGDRGVLFYDPKTEQILLIRWDSIKRIAREKNGPR